MTDTSHSFNVKLWRVETRKRAKATTYRVRWFVAGEPFHETFATSNLADSYRSSLMSAMRAGEAFDRVTGLPRSMNSTRLARTWVQVAQEFIDANWDDFAPRHRKSTAEGLVTVTCALVREGRTPPDAKRLRLALMHWEFNTRARSSGDTPPDEYREALRWIADNSRPVDHLNNLDGIRQALDALSHKLDGNKASRSTVARKRAALSGALNYAVEKHYLIRNLMGEVRSTRRQGTAVVDPGVVVNPKQAVALLDAVQEIHPPLRAYFACIYYGALRPAEARNVRDTILKLPDEGWGEFVLGKSYQEAGSDWTDSGEQGEERGLKHRSEEDSRPVPIHPHLVQILREHIEEYGTGVDGRLFVTRTGRGGNGGVPLPPPYQNPVSMKTVYRVWDDARAKALTPKQYASPLAARPYDLRHACVSTWLASGVDATQVAKWAGHSVDVLMRVYAKCLDDREDAAKRRIEAMFTNSDPSGRPEQGTDRPT